MLLSLLPSYLTLDIVSEWCFLEAICCLDSATTNLLFRHTLLSVLNEFAVLGQRSEPVSMHCLQWLSAKKIAPRHVNLKTSLRPTLSESEWVSLHKWNLNSLTTLRMDHCSNQHFTILQAAIHDSCCLTELNILNIYQAVSNDVLDLIADSPKTISLRVLELKFNLVVLSTNTKFFQSMTKYRQMRELRLVGCSRFSAGIIESIANSLCESLTVLVLHYNVQDHACALRFIASKCVHLVELSLCCFFIDYENISLLARQCPSLASLSLTQCYQIKLQDATTTTYVVPMDTSQAPIGPIHTFPALTFLNVKHNGSWLLQPMIVMLLKACPQLLALNMQSSMYQTDNSSIMQFVAAHLPRLTHLDVSVCPGLTRDLVHLTTQCRELRDVNLQACDVTDEALTALGDHCSHLKTLNLLSNYQITTNGVLYLVDSCQELSKLTIMRGTHSLIVNELNVDAIRLHVSVRNNKPGSTRLEVA